MAQNIDAADEADCGAIGKCDPQNKKSRLGRLNALSANGFL
jgi:hypothetical protein